MWLDWLVVVVVLLDNTDILALGSLGVSVAAGTGNVGGGAGAGAGRDLAGRTVVTCGDPTGALDDSGSRSC